MVKIHQIENELMHSNCYIVKDDITKECIIVDPGSRDSHREIEYIEALTLTPTFIILTHEHTDHTWGVNAILDVYPSVKVITYDKCRDELPSAGDMYFRLYYNDPEYHYEVRRVDIEIHKEEELKLGSFTVLFIPTPGHSIGSMSFLIDKYIFTGDTIMKFKIYVSKKSGDKETLKKTIDDLKARFLNSQTIVCPGHGPTFLLKDY